MSIQEERLVKDRGERLAGLDLVVASEQSLHLFQVVG
jgi:hypothetical protein